MSTSMIYWIEAEVEPQREGKYLCAVFEGTEEDGRDDFTYMSLWWEREFGFRTAHDVAIRVDYWANIPSPTQPGPIYVSDLRLSTRTKNALHSCDIKTVAVLRKLTSSQLLNVPNLGRKSAVEVWRALAEVDAALA